MNMFQVPKLTSQPQNRPVQQAQQPPLNRTVGNNKTCNWVFENGEVCTIGMYPRQSQIIRKNIDILNIVYPM